MSQIESANDGESEDIWALSIDPDLVRLIVVKARASLFEVPDAEEDEPELEMELDSATTLEKDDPSLLSDESEPDETPVETAAMIDSLSAEEQTELIALTMIGRGDFEPGELDAAMRAARESVTGPASGQLLEMELFPNLLATGLESYESWVAEQGG